LSRHAFYALWSKAGPVLIENPQPVPFVILKNQLMKTQYNRLLTSLCSLIITVFLVSCTSTLSYNEALQKNVSNIDDTEKLEDARFLLNAASYNTLAMWMAQAAIESGYSASVVRMARENLEAHEEMEDDLRKLARKEDIVLPEGMNSEHERMLAELTSTDRREFDRTYLRLLREVSEQDSRKFANMATEAQSEDIRAFAARKLDLFESHQQEIQTVDAELLRTY
jgi:putative membrane protein